MCAVGTRAVWAIAVEGAHGLGACPPPMSGQPPHPSPFQCYGHAAAFQRHPTHAAFCLFSCQHMLSSWQDATPRTDTSHQQLPGVAVHTICLNLPTHPPQQTAGIPSHSTLTDPTMLAPPVGVVDMLIRHILCLRASHSCRGTAEGRAGGPGSMHTFEQVYMPSTITLTLCSASSTAAYQSHLVHTLIALLLLPCI